MTKDDIIRRENAIETVKDTMKRLVDDEPRGDSDTLTEYCAKLAKLTRINEEILKALSALPSAEAETVDCTEFIRWLTETVMDDGMWELNAVAYGEVIARKLTKRLWLFDHGYSWTI